MKLLAQDGELYVFAQSRDRITKERAMRRRQLKRLWARLRQISAMTLTRRLHGLAPGLTARNALAKFAAVQMIDVHLPTTDGREIILTRTTEPELNLLLQKLKLELPAQPPPKITAAPAPPSPL